MHPREVAAWLTRLHHLLVVERYGFSRVRFPGQVPAAARTRTIRHLARQADAVLDPLLDAWPEIQSLPIWTDLKATLWRAASPMPAPMTRRGHVEQPGVGPLARMHEALRRLAYLHDEEDLSDDAFGLLTLSEAWRVAMHEVPNPLGNLIELYLDASATQRLIIRFQLRNRRVLDESTSWRSLGDRELLARFAAVVDRQRELLGDAPADQLERLRRAGAVSPNFSSVPSFDLDAPLESLGRVPSGHFELQPVQEPVLLTMATVL